MVADRVRDLTGGGVRPVTLRVVVAAGVAAGPALGAVRVVVGVRLEYSLLLLILLLSLRRHGRSWLSPTTPAPWRPRS
jgi:Protein of unknown function (DUF1538)